MRHDDTLGTVFRDVLTLTLLGFVALLLIVVAHLNPVLEAREVDSPGNVIVEIAWPAATDADVDLWVRGPAGRAVGYSNKGGLLFNLLRDDLGHRGDATDLNYEVSYSRGAPAGEYVVNVHLYRAGDAPPVPVRAAVSLKPSSALNATPLFSGDVALRRVGDEVTVFRFRLDGDGRYVAGSLNALPTPLRAAP